MPFGMERDNTEKEKEKIMRLRTGRISTELSRPHAMTYKELVAESERLEDLLAKGELTEKESRRLVKIRVSMERLDDVKYD
jgi:hypothetical protein